MARPQQPHHQSWDNKPVPGLYRCPDGRWRINATGRKFTEPDEVKAIARFREWENAQRKLQDVRLPPEDISLDQVEGLLRSQPKRRLLFRIGRDGALSVSRMEDARPLWAWMREQLLTNLEEAARMTGLPDLVRLRSLPMPRPSIKLSHLRTLYERHNEATAGTKRAVLAAFDEFVAVTEAKTLEELTTQRLQDYRDTIRSRVNSPGTVAAYFGRCKYLIGFARSEGEDAQQIAGALARMAVLKAPRDTRLHRPTPVTREHFHRLLTKAGELYPAWQLRLMLMLNLCMHFDEMLGLSWDEFDLEAGTFLSHRNKTGRVVRAATLWPETVGLLGAVKRRGVSHVLVSAHGTRFNAKGQWKTWNKLRIAAGLETVQMDDIRDGAYTAACNAPGVEEKFARLLAGHRSHGLQDNYVARNPAIVRSACNAVYAAYGPFPSLSDQLRVSGTKAEG